MDHGTAVSRGGHYVKFWLSRIRFVEALVDQIEDESFACIGWHLGKCLLKRPHARKAMWRRSLTQQKISLSGIHLPVTGCGEIRKRRWRILKTTAGRRGKGS